MQHLWYTLLVECITYYICRNIFLLPRTGLNDYSILVTEKAFICIIHLILFIESWNSSMELEAKNTPELSVPTLFCYS